VTPAQIGLLGQLVSKQQEIRERMQEQREFKAHKVQLKAKHLRDVQLRREASQTEVGKSATKVRFEAGQALKPRLDALKAESKALKLQNVRENLEAEQAKLALKKQSAIESWLSLSKRVTVLGEERTKLRQALCKLDSIRCMRRHQQEVALEKVVKVKNLQQAEKMFRSLNFIGGLGITSRRIIGR